MEGGSCGIPLSSLHPHHPPRSPHVSQDDDLRVFTCASPPPPCKDELDASPSALVPWLPWPSPGQQLGLHPAPPPFFVFLSEVDHKKGKRKKTAAAFRAAKICWVFVIHIVISGFSIQHSHFAGLAGAINVLQTQQSQKYSISVQLCRPLIFLNMHF